VNFNNICDNWWKRLHSHDNLIDTTDWYD
jgi:hypothetical protein